MRFSYFLCSGCLRRFSHFSIWKLTDGQNEKTLNPKTVIGILGDFNQNILVLGILASQLGVCLVTIFENYLKKAHAKTWNSKQKILFPLK